MNLTDDIANWEIFVWSLHELGGSSEFVDVENVFFRSFEHSANRFSWRTRRLPDHNKCAKAMRDADARVPRLLIKTKDGLKRQLTVEGQKWVCDHEVRLGRLLTGDHVIGEPKRRPTTRLLASIERSAEFSEWLAHRDIPVEKWRIAELFRCSPDSGEGVWKSRLEVLRSVAYASNQKELLAFLDAVAESRAEWF